MILLPFPRVLLPFKAQARGLRGLASLLLWLDRGVEWGWTSPAVLLLLLLAVTLLMAFLKMERGNPHAPVDLTICDRSSFSLSVAALNLTLVSGYLLTVLLPFYLIQGRHMPSGGRRISSRRPRVNPCGNQAVSGRLCG